MLFLSLLVSNLDFPAAAGRWECHKVPKPSPRALGSRKRGRQAPGGGPAYGAVSGDGSCWRQSIRVLRPDRFPGGWGGFSGDCWRPGQRLSEVSGPGPKSVIFHPGGYWGARTGSLVSFRGVLGMSLPADQSGPAHARQPAFRESNATNEKGQAQCLPLRGTWSCVSASRFWFEPNLGASLGQFGCFLGVRPRETHRPGRTAGNREGGSGNHCPKRCLGLPLARATH